MTPGGWLEKSQIVAAVVLPQSSGVVKKHRESIPKETRRAKLVATGIGLIACALAYAGYDRWGWSGWVWGPVGFFGANVAAGDYRRLVGRLIWSGISDGIDFLMNIARKFGQLKEAIENLRLGAKDKL